MTVSEAWSYGPPSGAESFFCAGMGDADWQPQTGNVVICNSELVEDEITYTQILEVTPDGRRVFELVVRGTEPDSAYPSYRAERIPDLRQ